MKPKFTVVAASQLFAFGLNAAVIFDSFNDPSLDTSLWLAQAPYSDSSVTVHDGYLDLLNGGNIITIQDMGTYADITGRFQYAGSSYDQFGVMLRSDGGRRYGTYGTFSTGVLVEFNLRSGDQGGFDNNVKINSSGLGGDVVTVTYPLSVGVWYDFRILDLGNAISVFIGDLENPILEHTTSLGAGNYIGFQNREGAGNGSSNSAGSETHIDFISIIPEPEAYSAFLVALAFLGITKVRRLRNASH